MTDKVIGNRKKEYGMMDNVTYLIKNMWKWDKKLFIFFLIQIPLLIVGPILSIYIPKILIDSVESNLNTTEFLMKVGAPIIGIIVVETILGASNFKTQIGGIVYRFRYIEKQIDKAIDTDYENIDGPKGQEKFMKANMATGSDNSGTQAIIPVLIGLLSNVIGIILYAAIIFTIHPLFIIFIMVSSFINYIIGDYANKFEYKNKDSLAPVQKN